MGTATATGGIVKACEVARAVAQHGDAFLGQRGQHKLAHFAGGQLVARNGVDDFRQDVVFPQVHAALGFFALHGHAGAHDFGESVNIEGVDAHFVLNIAAHGLGPGFRAKDADAQGQIAKVHAHFLRGFPQVQTVGGGSAQHCCAKIAQQPA